MELINASRMNAGYTLGMDSSGRESVVVVVKGTFGIPSGGREAELLPNQAPLVTADTFEGEPGFSAPVYETDFAPIKPMCDVIVLGSAHAPRGRPTTSMDVSLEIGPIKKRIHVVGDRRWISLLWLAWPGPAKPFTIMPLSYGRAFGGIDPVPDKPEKARMHLDNHVGVGFSVTLWGLGKMRKHPAPNLERPGKPVWSTRSRHKPIGFGPIGRAWRPRPTWAGTYDQNWQDEVFPFLPADFDTRYFQCAPLDQQMEHPKGGEKVELTGLTPEGRSAFRLPGIDVPLEFTNMEFERTRIRSVIDTVVIEPDLGRFTVVWRGSLPLKRNIRELRDCVVGTMPKGWYRARELGKDYLPSLASLAGAGAEAD